MFDRLELLIGKENLENLSKLSVLIIGVGGVGGGALEGLVRSGILNITIIDGDIVDVTNLNRQLIATEETIALSKVKAAEKRALSINAEINIKLIDKYLMPEDMNLLDGYDYIVDACDNMEVKKAIIKYADINKLNLISSMGMGKRIDPSKIKLGDIKETSYDPLAKEIRKFCREEKIDKLKVVYSSEQPHKTKGVGTSAFVPPAAGLLMASYIVRDAIDFGKDQ